MRFIKLLLALTMQGSLAWTAGTLQADYEILRDAVYGYTRLDTIRQLYQNARVTVNRERHQGWERNYWLSRMATLMGRAVLNERLIDSAEVYYREALECIDSSLLLDRFSEGYRMKAEILGQLCDVRYRMHDFWFLVTTGPKIRELAAHALQLNPQNGKAYIVIAAAEIYLPAVFGGKVEEALRLLEKARRMPDLETDDEYNILLGTGVALSKMGNMADARRYFQEALRIYPSNRFASTCYDDVVRKAAKKPP